MIICLERINLLLETRHESPAECYPLPMPPTLLKPLFCLVLAAATALAADAPKKRPISLDDLNRIQRVSAPRLSPDGEWLLYTVSQVDAKEDKSQSHLWMSER